MPATDEPADKPLPIHQAVRSDMTALNDTLDGNRQNSRTEWPEGRTKGNMQSRRGSNVSDTEKPTIAHSSCFSS